MRKLLLKHMFTASGEPPALQDIDRQSSNGTSSPKSKKHILLYGPDHPIVKVEGRREPFATDHEDPIIVVFRPKYQEKSKNSRV